MVITCLAMYHAGRSIYSSVERQLLLHSQANSLKAGLKQAEEVNQDLRDGLTNYRSSNGLERLARERLNLAGQDEIIVRLGK
jgi:cell division protein FtsB